MNESRVQHRFTLLFVLGAASTVSAQPATVTFQGHLSDQNLPAHGFYDLQFTLYDASINGNPVGDPLSKSSVMVTQGLFTVELEYGLDSFDGSDRWIEIGVRSSSQGPYTTLAPRQPINSTPYALRAAAVDKDPRSAIAIHLHRGSGGTQYIVPQGKVLLVENVAFNDTWINSGDQKLLYLQHSTNPSGPVWQTTIYYSVFTSLTNPLKVPAGKALTAPYDDNILHKCFLYGELVDDSSVNAVAIHLHSASGGTQYIVPDGNILVVEYVCFNDTWQNSSEQKLIYIQHSVNPSGPVWNTTLNYFSGFNKIAQPLRIPAGKAVSIPYLDNILYKCFLYGRLEDSGE